VYRAVNLDANRREVVIKRLQLTALTPRQVIDATETFHREITMLARFSNVKGIPKFYEYLTDAENWYLIMRYIPGQTLENYLQKAPGGYLKEKEVIHIGIGLAGVLQTLHTSDPPVIFRDVKPANIMITPDHKFCLIDFGIARNFTPGKKKDTIPLGSPGFAPPEQYGHSQTDQRADIYSLGATLRTLLTGRDPLELRNGEASHNPHAPSRKLDELLDEMLSVEIDQRPADISQAQKRLVFIQNRPFMTGMMGAVFGAVLSIPSLFGSSSNFWLNYLMLFVAVVVEAVLRAKLKLSNPTPKSLRRFWWLGVLTYVLLLALGPWLWHLFFR
jgi:serine/threonine protein kinase